MPAYTTDPIVRGPGWAVERVGPVVLGFWNTHLNAERLHVCRRAYRRAHELHGKFSVFAIFRGNPWSKELATGKSERALTVSIFKEFTGHFDALICVVDATGLSGAMLRLGAAAIIPLTPRSIPITFPANVDDGACIGRRAGTFKVVDEATVRAHLTALERSVLAP